MCHKLLRHIQTWIGENETAVSNIKAKKLKQQTSSGHVTSINSTEHGFLKFYKENILPEIERRPIHTFDNSSEIGKFSNKTF